MRAKKVKRESKRRHNGGFKPPEMDEQGIEPWTTPNG
jgi:hypothetical protein